MKSRLFIFSPLPVSQRTSLPPQNWYDCGLLSSYSASALDPLHKEREVPFTADRAAVFSGTALGTSLHAVCRPTATVIIITDKHI